MNFRFWWTSTASTRSGMIDEQDPARAEPGRDHVAVFAMPTGQRPQPIALNS